MYAARKIPNAALQTLLMVDGSLDPEDHVVAGIRAAVIDYLDHVVTGLPELAAILVVRGHEIQQRGAIGVLDQIAEAAALRGDADIEELESNLNSEETVVR